MREKLKLIKNLLEKRRAREKEGLFVVEGPHLVEEAIRSGAEIEYIVTTHPPTPSLKKRRGAQIGEIIEVNAKQFAELSDVETPQGILAVVKVREYRLEDLRTEGVIVFCHEIQDPGNFGTIIRTADAAGASGIILSKGTVDLYNSKTLRATMGSLFHLPIVEIEDVHETLSFLKKNNIKTVATSLSASKNYFEVDYKDGVAIVVGNEGAGLPKEVVKSCDEIVKIPMPGKAESLNVAVSTALLLYEVIRQHR